MDDELTPLNYVQKIKAMLPADRWAITAKKLIELILETNDPDERQRNVDLQLANIQTSMSLISDLAKSNKQEINALKNENEQMTREIWELKDKDDENAGGNEAELTSQIETFDGRPPVCGGFLQILAYFISCWSIPTNLNLFVHL